MKNTLIICSDYFANTDANGVCVKNIVNELLTRGYNVSVISESKQSDLTPVVLDGVNVYKVRSTLFSRMLKRMRTGGKLTRLLVKLFSVLRSLTIFWIYPNVSPIRSHQVLKKAREIINNENIDTVIGFYRPYESIYATLKLKEKYKDRIKAITYHLDLMQSPSNKSGFIVKYKLFRGKKAIEKEYRLLDLVMLPESADDTYKKREKSVTLDFPLYIKAEPIKCESLPFEKEYINISFIGTLDKNNRNPQYVISVIEEFNKTAVKKLRLNVWGKLADIETDEVINQSESVRYHNTMENKYVSYALSQSDAVLNIGNKFTYDMIPSKIFQLFAAKRPIINVVSHPKDASLGYFEKYSFSLNIDEFSGDLKADALKLSEFLNNNLTVEISVSDDVYIKSTPAYAVKLIESVWK